eukprot:g7462.t1
MRLGKDSQIPFGHCFLSLAPAKEPVVSPSGHIYSKPVICEYMLQKIKELKKQRKAYEAQEAAKSREESRKKSEIEGKSVKEFLAIQDDPTLRTNATSSDGFKKSKEDEESSNKKKRRPREIFDGDTREKKRRALEKVSYWLPSAAPDAGPEQIKKPPKRPPSPITGAPLRMKHLTPATLTLDPDDKSVFICPVSKKRITTQKCILIKTTGHVILKSVFDKIKGQSKDLACPVTGEPIRESDVLNLARVSSGFAATGNVMAEKWRPGIG